MVRKLECECCVLSSGVGGVRGVLSSLGLCARVRCVYKMPKFFHLIRGSLLLLLNHLMQLQELYRAGSSYTTSSMVALDASQLALRNLKQLSA
ncbi:hypothetical protein WN51_03426 [Melipona quadrifasciata]|uniref:Uncharacterized protein n=1 Tax=Melipona quadrifasciata TaxID=166423 RepID=A0A0N0BKV7_9HYME|nr:hypothetical protein WN51_03426 [Melipona quadrifasciata]